MKTVELTNPSKPLLETLLESPNERVILCVDGESVGAVTFEPELDEPPIDISRSPRLQEILKASRESYRKHGGIPAEEVRRKVREWEAEESSAASPSTSTGSS